MNYTKICKLIALLLIIVLMCCIAYLIFIYWWLSNIAIAVQDTFNQRIDNTTTVSTIQPINISNEVYRTLDNSIKIECEALKQFQRDKNKPVVQVVSLGYWQITGYDICMSCCGKTDGITASMTKATVGRTIAAPKEIPFGTIMFIEGIGERVVEDRGGAIKGTKIDVLCNNHQECNVITGKHRVWIINYP